MAPHSSRLFSTFLVGAAAWVLLSHVAPVFVGTAPAVRNMRGSIARQGFKEDFDAWRNGLTAEEKELMAEQTEKVFDKKYLKTERAQTFLPQEKIDSFGNVLSKFFDAEGDYKSDGGVRKPDYDGIQKKLKNSEKEFTLRSKIIEMDMDAERRYNWASITIKECEKQGKYFPNCTPRKEIYQVPNDTPETQKTTKMLLDYLQKAVDSPDVPAEVKKEIEEGIKSVPADKNFEIMVPADVINMIAAWKVTQDVVIAAHPDDDEAAKKKFMDEAIPKLNAQMLGQIVKNWTAATEYIAGMSAGQKKFFSTYEWGSKKSKADVLKEIWALLPKYLEREVSPLDEELLAELSELPADEVGQAGKRHSWGDADKLYKSEAIDSFGAKYLLGVYESQEEAKANFDAWNEEFKKARSTMAEEFAQYSKRENARLDSDTTAKDRIMAALEDARGKLYN